MRLSVVICSTRPGRLGSQVASWFTERAIAHGAFEVQVVDLAEVGLPFLDEPEHPSARRYVHDHTRAWSALVDESDAFVLVMPEYNYGMNAPLKNALDFLYHEWAHKPVAFVSYGGTSAGTRAVQMVKQVVTTLRMYPIHAMVAIHTRQYVDEDRVLRATPDLDADAADVLDELATMTPLLRPLRAQPASV